ncbi:MAG: IMP cyclohydrolase [Candidatus Desulfofervidaceae bacterium]|nr:IMP cyclohydrolase [Candidatus Desulfofervidaceae bacterium]
MKDLKKIYKDVVSEHFPEEIKIVIGEQTLIYRKRIWDVGGEKRGLRYGENPHQEAALYELVNGNLVLGDCHFVGADEGLVSALQETDFLQFGKHPSMINLTDLDRGLQILRYLMAKPAAVIMKHNNPSGVAYGNSLAEAFERAYFADRIAAFGGCVVVNRTLDKDTAGLISQYYVEVVAAPDYAPGVVDILKQRKNLRIIEIKRIDRLSEYAHKRWLDFKALMDGGLILQQSPYTKIKSKEDFYPAETTYKGDTYRIKRLPTEKELNDLLFGWYVEQGVTSNSVLFVKDEATVAIGTGEQDRVGVAEIAIYKAYTKYADALCFKKYGIPYKVLEMEIAEGKRPQAQKEEIDTLTQEARGGLKGAVMISDAFFPFRDGVDVAIKEGITAIAQPGGSIRDFESILACNEADPPVAMVYTGERAFRH